MSQLNLFETGGQEPAKSPMQLAAEREIANREAEERKRIGIERSANRERDWTDRAKSVIQVYLVRNETFFVDEFWASEMIEQPENMKALGHVVRYASKQKWMTKSGQFRNSVRSNNSPKPIWKSEIYGGAK